MTGEGLATQLEAEHVSVTVPAKLTANVMKIGLAAAPVVAGTWLSAKIFLLAVSLIAIVIGGITIRHRQTISASLPMIVAKSGKDSLQWQTTQPSARAVLAGRILDDANHGIAGATVTLVRKTPYHENQTVTDAAGNYAFASIPSAGTYRIGVSAEGFVAIHDQEHYYRSGPEVEITPNSQTQRDIIMERGLRVEVTVTDALGQPIAGAWVTAFAPNNDPMIDVGGHSNDLGAASMTVPLSDRGYIVAAQASGYAPTHAVISAKQWKVPVRLNFALSPGQNIKCVAICSDGKPAAGWSIDAFPEWWNGLSFPEPAKIDSNGNFTLHDIGSGRYRLLIQKTDVVVTLPPSHQPLRIDLPIPSPGTIAHLRGTVYFTGLPRSAEVLGWAMNVPDGWKQYFIRIPPPRPGEKTAPEPIDFGQVPPGNYELRFSGADIQPLFNVQFPVPGPLPPIKLNVVGIARLTGTVTDASTGKPIVHFAIRPRLIETYFGRRIINIPDQPWVQVSNADGRFYLDVDGAGVYVVQASADAHATITSQAVHIQPGAMTGVVNIQLSASLLK